ncbi:MAG: acylphosphatase [Candidatus Babeliales bacterium]
MNQCLHIRFSLDEPMQFLYQVIQKNARELGIEGIVQMANPAHHEVRLLACGSRSAIDDFLDLLHKEAAQEIIKNIEIEPFVKERDFRGVFRVIE